jgi:polysaccharide biosynthesis PFTS motif protein
MIDRITKSDQFFHNRAKDRLRGLTSFLNLKYKEIPYYELQRDIIQRLYRSNQKYFFDDDFHYKFLAMKKSSTCLFTYLKYSFGILLTILSTLFQRKISTKFNSFTLFLDLNLSSMIPFKDYRNKFSQFLYESSLKSNVAQTNIVIRETQSDSVNGFCNDIFFTKNFIFTDIFRFNTISKTETFFFIFKYTFKIPGNILKITQNKYIAQMSQDIATYELIKLLNSHKLIKNIIISNSSILHQPFWLNYIGETRYFKSHIIFYSTNNKRLCHRDDETNKHNQIPYIHLLKTDIAHTWNKLEEEWLSENTQIEKVYSEKPILLYPNRSDSKTKKKRKKVCIFDIPVFLDSHIDKVVSINRYHYYSLETIRKYLMDTIDCSHQHGYSVTVKLKRGLSSKHHQKEYINLLSELKKKVEVIDYPCDIYELLSDKDYIINIPFTSTYHVAKYLKINSCFYDPTGKLLLPNGIDSTDLCINKDELSLFLKS